MYGDTAVIRAKAGGLRELAAEVRLRAASMGDVALLDWKSAAAVRFVDDVTERAHSMGTAADQLDEAAAKLEAHANAVDAVKAAIEEAAHWVSNRWNEAATLVGNVVESVKEGVGRVFEFFGQDVPHFLVDRAEDIVRSVPSLPVRGSKDWLDTADTFIRRGWR